MSDQYQVLKKKRCLELLRECQQSGQPKRIWCKEHGIGYSTFMRWQKQLRNELAGGILAEQAIVPIAIPAQLTYAEKSSQGILIRNGDTELRLPESVSAEYLVSILRGLR